MERSSRVISVLVRFARRAAQALGIATVGGLTLVGAAQAEGPLDVVATTGMIADAVREVGGDEVSVRGLMGPGVDPHAYRQTRSDIVALTRADLVVWHGLFLEAQMRDFLADLGRSRDVVAVGEAVPTELLIAHDSYVDKYDPHVWMDPAIWVDVVEAVRAALSDARPEAAKTFAANAERYAGEIEALVAYAKAVLATVPEESRVLVTAHDAFNYFGRAYGFEVVGIQGISTESEAGIRRVSDVVDVLVDRKVAAVFVESSVSDRNVRALVEGAAAEGHRVVIGGELYSDAMGAGGTYEGTYLGMIDHNATTIARALGGDVPERGMSGRLAAGS